MTAVAAVVGDIVILGLFSAVALCLIALAVGFVQQVIADFRHPHVDAVVVPLQRPSNVRIVHDHTDVS